MAIYLLSDPHLGHRLAARDRGFATVEDHDRTVLYNIRRAVRGDQNPEMWWLGDIAFDGWRDRIEVIGDIPGVHHLVIGNHDRVFPAHSRAYDYQRAFLEVFSSVQLMARLSFEGQGFVVSHFPLDGDHVGGDRFAEWRPRDTGKPVLHGHTHSRERFSLSKAGTPQIHVGLDAWGLSPVRIEEAVQTLRDGVSSKELAGG